MRNGLPATKCRELWRSSLLSWSSRVQSKWYTISLDPWEQSTLGCQSTMLQLLSEGKKVHSPWNSPGRHLTCCSWVICLLEWPFLLREKNTGYLCTYGFYWESSSSLSRKWISLYDHWWVFVVDLVLKGQSCGFRNMTPWKKNKIRSGQGDQERKEGISGSYWKMLK